jgi:hypothetical protein
MITADQAAILLGSVLVLMIWTYMYKATPIFYYGTAVCVGATMGHFFVSALYSLQTIAWNRLFVPADIWVIIPIILGFLLFGRFRRGYAWLSTTSISIIAGYSLGLLVAGGIQTDIFNQLRVLVALKFAGADAWTVFNNIVILVCAFTVIAFFIFQKTLAENVATRWVSRIGRLLMLGMGGVAFATGYGFRITMALNAMQPFVATWPGQLGIPIVGLMFIVLYLYQRSR